MTRWNDPGYDAYPQFMIPCEACGEMGYYVTGQHGFVTECNRCGNSSKKFQKVAKKRKLIAVKERLLLTPKNCYFCASKVAPDAKHCPSCGTKWPGSTGKHPFFRTLLGEIIDDGLIQNWPLVFIWCGLVAIIIYLWIS